MASLNKKDGDGDGKYTGPSGKDDTPVGGSAAPARVSDPSLEAELADLKKRAAKPNMTAEEAAKFREDAMALRAKVIAAKSQANSRTSSGIDEDTGLSLNEDGTVTVYHHTSAAKAAVIEKTGVLKSAGEPDVYVTSRSETDTGYGDTAVAIRVKPSLLTLDDEFPDGRRDFRIDAKRPGGSVRVTVERAASAPMASRIDRLLANLK